MTQPGSGRPAVRGLKLTVSVAVTHPERRTASLEHAGAPSEHPKEKSLQGLELVEAEDLWPPDLIASNVTDG